MFKHLLVPLDGSHLAEAALPAAVYLAKVLGARVTLLHVIERDAPREVHGDRHLNDADEAKDYLAGIARAFPAGVHVEQHVHGAAEKDVANGIAMHVEEWEPDLIVMCTHGRGGLRGWMYGRIAHRVAKLGKVPVLLVPAVAGAAPAFSCNKLLVALDGNPAHERGLTVGAGLAKFCGAELHLIMVVHQLKTLSGEQAATASILPGATSVLLDLAEQGAEQYLSRHVALLQAEGFTATADVRRGDPVTVIVDAAEQTEADMVVIATHGKTGMEAFWSGSPTPNMAKRSVVPLLLVPVSENASD